MRWVRLLYALAVVAVCALLVREIAERLTRCTPDPRGIYEDEIFHHTLPRCLTYVEKDFVDRDTRKQLEYEIEVRVNSLGFRNREYAVEKPDSVRRLVLLGDSFTYGYGLELENAFFTRLEAKLEARLETPIEVWNLAVVSWSTLIQGLVVERKLDLYRPDLVVLMFDDSDPYDNAAYRKFGRYEDGALVGVSGDMESFWAERRALRRRVDALEGDPAAQQELLDGLQDLAFAAIRAMAERLEARGVPLLVVFYPYPRPDPAGYERRTLGRLQERLTRHGIDHASLYPDFASEERQRRFYFETNRHWNAAGSEYVAGWLARELTSRYPETLR